MMTKRVLVALAIGWSGASADAQTPPKPVASAAPSVAKCPVMGTADEAPKPATAAAVAYGDKNWWPNLST